MDSETRNRSKKKSVLENENEDTVKDDNCYSGKGSRRRKLQDMDSVLMHNPIKMETLKKFAITQGGLLRDEMRRRVWPLLLELQFTEVSPKPSISEMQQYKDYHQVLLDVNRSLRRFPPGIEESRRLDLQEELTHLIVRILLKHPELNYYQGYHDICITFLLVMGPERSFSIVEKISLTYLRDFLAPTMQETVKIMNLIYPILSFFNKQLRDHIYESDVGTIFCLSWLITWFGHVLNDYKGIVRLYDFFLASDRLMPVYLAAAILLHRETDIMATEKDMALMHAKLSYIPDDLPFEKLICDSRRMFQQFPPELAQEALKPSPWHTRFHSYIPYMLNSRWPQIILRRAVWLSLVVVPATAAALYTYKYISNTNQH